MNSPRVNNKLGENEINEINAFIAEDNEACKELWKEAISEVVLRMYALQAEEQKEASSDNLSLLLMNTDSIEMSLFSERCRNKMTTKSEPILSRVRSEEKQPNALTIEDQIKQIRKRSAILAPSESVWSNKRSKISSANLSYQNDDDVCPKCKSLNTKVTGGNYNATKSETWGNKDNMDVLTFLCRDCGFSKEI